MPCPLYDVSQLPVMDQGEIGGLVDESELLIAAQRDTSLFRYPMREIMSTKPITVDAHAPLESLMPLFDQGLVVIVRESEHFSGLITRVDALNHLCRKLS